MKKEMKLISLLVLIWVLLASTTTNAGVVYITEDSLEDYSFEDGYGTVEVTDIADAGGTVSDLSLRLAWPTPLDDKSGIKVTDIDTGVTDVDSWNYWTRTEDIYSPHLVLFLSNVYDVTTEDYLDNYGSEDYSSKVYINGYEPGDMNWHQIQDSDTYQYRMFFNGDFSVPIIENIDWSTFQSETFEWYGVHELDYSNAIVEGFRISNDGIGGYDSQVVYIDDFTFGDTDYVIGIPEPTTIALLGLSGLFLLRR